MDFIRDHLFHERLIAISKQTKVELLEFHNRMVEVVVKNCKVMKFTPTSHIFCGLWMGGRIRPPFPCVSYEATKERPDGSTSTAWDYIGLQCNLYSLGWRDRWMPAQNAASIFKALVSNPHSTPFTHGATCY